MDAEKRKVTKEEMKTEAMKRMKLLDLPETVLRLFEERNMVVCSSDFFGYVILSPRQKHAIRDFEKKYDALVYLVVQVFSPMGEMDSLLFISKDQNEWDMDHESIKDGYLFTYTINWDAPMFSEFGDISYKKNGMKQIIRTN